MKRHQWPWVFFVLVAGCTLPVRMQGIVKPVTWSTTAFDLRSERTFDGDTEHFAFTLVLQETQGLPLTLTTITWEVWQKGVDRSGRQMRTGSWSLPAHGTLRQPFVYSIFCPPAARCPAAAPTTQWDIAFQGTDAQGQPIHIALEPELPWIPPRAVANPLPDLQRHPSVVLPPIHLTMRMLYYPLVGQ